MSRLLSSFNSTQYWNLEQNSNIDQDILLDPNVSIIISLLKCICECNELI